MMMSVDEFSKKYLWQAANDSQMVEFLNWLGSEEMPKASRSDPDYYLEADDHQLTLHFVDEDYLAKRDVKKYGTAPMVLVSAEVPVVAPGDERTSVIELPLAVVEGISRDTVLAEVGKSPDRTVEFNGRIRNDQWYHEACRVLYIYGKEGELKKVQIISNQY